MSVHQHPILALCPCRGGGSAQRRMMTCRLRWAFVRNGPAIQRGARHCITNANGVAVHCRLQWCRKGTFQGFKLPGVDGRGGSSRRVSSRRRHADMGDFALARRVAYHALIYHGDREGGRAAATQRIAPWRYHPTSLTWPQGRRPAPVHAAGRQQLYALGERSVPALEGARPRAEPQRGASAGGILARRRAKPVAQGQQCALAHRSGGHRGAVSGCALSRCPVLRRLPGMLASSRQSSASDFTPAP